MVGFNAKNITAVSDVFKCSLCKLLLRDPHQLDCGHRWCKSCIDSKLQNSIDCDECIESTPKDQIMPDRGARKDMSLLQIHCYLCDWIGTFQDYEAHLNQSHANPACPYCGQKFPNIDTLETHKSQECTKITVSCPLKDFGCTETVIRADLPAHYLQPIHQQALMNFVQRFLPKLMPEQHDRNPGMDIDFANVPTTQRDGQSVTTTDESMTTPIRNVYETINIIAGGLQALHDDTQRLSDSAIRMQTRLDALNNDLSSLKISIQEQGASFDGLKLNQDVLEQEIESLKQKVEDGQYVSYDGTLIWRITSVREKMMDAQSERQTSIYSSPFYSSPNGYKMRARLYLHGDGNARRTHMSLFFVLMRGPNDSILKFPFNYKVTFCLYDQTPQQRHIIDSFRPDIKSNSFQRPRSDMNIASGIPKFFPLNNIQSDDNPYVKDDTMFIKIMVDFGDMPKTILPYALNLNPGLPMHVQQAMVKQELTRRSLANPVAAGNTPTDSGSVLQQFDPKSG